MTELLNGAVELPLEEREAYLDAACAGDRSLRREVTSLVRAHEESGRLGELAEFVPLLQPPGASPMEVEDGESARYRILERIGRGGMGVVYRARDRRLERTVALKFLPWHMGADPGARKRFLSEARAAAALDHPHICTVHEIGEDSRGRPFIAMSFYEGETMKAKLAKGPLSVKEAVDFAVQTARGLEEAHGAGVLHRDLKPANLMVTADARIKILDFGLAKRADADPTEAGGPMGTAAYMSPEQVRGEEVDQRTDVWSLGVVLYEMLTGERPFRAEHEQAVLYKVCNEEPEPVTDLRGEVPGTLAAVVMRCLERDLTRRYPGMPALTGALRNLTRISRTAPTGRAEETVPSIAVLPFSDMSPDRDQAYFCEGIAEEILSALDRLEGLRVAARTSSFQHYAAGTDIREMGRRLDVETVLEGSVRKSGGWLRITVQLIDVAGGYHLWSERFDRELEDIFAIQDEIARNTARALRGVLTEKDRHTLQKMPRTDVRAYDCYLRGRRFFYRKTERGHEFARQLFSRAIDIDPGYARAYAGLSDCSALLYKHFDLSPEHLERADAASRKGVELAPDLGETHASRGMVLSLIGEDEEAEREFETALRLSPELYEAYYLYATHEGYLRGNHDRAARLFERAAQVRPDDYEAPMLQAACYRGAGRNQKARAAYRRGLRLARRYMKLNPDDPRPIYLCANAMVALGETERGLEWAARARAVEPAPSAQFFLNMGAIHALAGEVDRALGFVDRAVHAGYRQEEAVENDPDLQALHDHPRFQALLRTLQPRPE